MSPLAHLTLLVMAVTKVRSSALARAFLLANLAASAGLVAGAGAGERMENAPEGATPRRLLAGPRWRGLGR